MLEENQIYRALLDRHSPGWRLQDVERKVLARKGRPLGQYAIQFSLPTRAVLPFCRFESEIVLSFH